MGRPLRTDARLAAVLALLPFAAAYGLIYWGEQYVPSGLAAVLFGVMPLYSAVLAALLLAGEPLRPRLLGGIAVALIGLSVAFGETLELGHSRFALAAAIACAAAPLASACGNVGDQARRRRARRRRAQRLGDARRRRAAAGGLRALGGVGGDLERPRGRLDRLPGRDRLRRAVRDADDPAAGAARGDDVLHHAACSRSGRSRSARRSTTSRSRCRPSAAPRSWPAACSSPSGASARGRDRPRG